MKEPKFVQVAVAHGDTKSSVHVCALDNQGRVWLNQIYYENLWFELAPHPESEEAKQED